MGLDMLNYSPQKCCSNNGCFGRSGDIKSIYYIMKTYSCFNQTTGFSFELQIKKSMVLGTRQTLRDMINVFVAQQERKH